MRWRLRPYCGHIIERSAHYTHKTLHGAFTGLRSCPDCGLDSAIIIDGEAIGLVEQPPGPLQPAVPTPPRKPTRAQLEAKIAELEAEIERLSRA